MAAHTRTYVSVPKLLFLFVVLPKIPVLFPSDAISQSPRGFVCERKEEDKCQHLSLRSHPSVDLSHTYFGFLPPDGRVVKSLEQIG